MSPISPETFAYILILSGFVLVFAELFVPSFGLLGIGGLALFTWGSSTIFDGDIMLIVYAIDTAALLIMAIVGGIMAREYARNHPDHVASVVTMVAVAALKSCEGATPDRMTRSLAPPARSASGRATSPHPPRAAATNRLASAADPAAPWR